MFSQVCVKNSVQIGEGEIRGGGVHPLSGQTPPQADISPSGKTRHEQTPRLGRHPSGRHTTSGQKPLPETVTAADSTHPTGMHPCC